MSAPELICGNVFIRRNRLDEGRSVQGHVHAFDHTTIVWSGSIHVKEVSPDGKLREQVYRRGEFFLVKAECWHEITGLEDDTEFWCVYSHRDPQGRVTQEFTGWEAAYR